MIRTAEMSRAQANELIRSCFREMDQPTAFRLRPRSNEPELDIQEQINHCSEHITYLQRQIDSRSPQPEVLGRIQELLVERGINEDPRTTSDQVIIGLLRALVEEQRLFQYRQLEANLPYHPVDPLFDGVVPGIGSPATTVSPGPQGKHKDRAIGPTLAELVEMYLAAKKGSWTIKTHELNRQKLQYLVDHLGGDNSVGSIEPGDIDDYAQALVRLRRLHHLGPIKSFASRQTDEESNRISPTTAAVTFSAARTFLEWAKKKRFMTLNPADDVTIEKPKVMKGVPLRRPFSPSELATLFNAPVFTGSASVHRVFTAGDVLVRDARFWIPTMAFYSGMRLGEIVQLHFDDVILEEPVSYLWVREEGGGALGSGTEKHVKSEAGIRKVPIHHDILALGFRQFVDKRRSQHKSKGRLFFEVSLGADGQASSVFSKWFGRLLDHAGLTDPRLVFHSFRHGMEDAFRNSLVPQYVIDSIVGHTEGKTSDGYGVGPSLEVKAEALRNAKLPISLLEIVAR